MTNALQELANPATPHHRRREIGIELANMGDPREGVGVKDGLPDMTWLPVLPAGEIELTRQWHPDTPDEEYRAWSIGRYTVPPFFIATYQLTNAQFAAFVADGYDDSRWWAGMPMQEMKEPRTDRPNNPRDTLSWYQAVAFGRWLTHQLHGHALPIADTILTIGDNAEVRLPTEWEWQWAAQGGAQKRAFPWGDLRDGMANTKESGLNEAIAVGMYPHGAAACGALDMAGNVMEWCANDKEDLSIIDVNSPAMKTLRGGDWGYGVTNGRCDYADGEDPDDADPLNGCRFIIGNVLFA